MIDLTDVPDSGPLPHARRAADQAMLRTIVASDHTPAPRRRGRIAIVSVVVGVCVVAAGGAAAAGVLLAAKPATDRDTGRCYSTVSSNFGDDFPGTSMGNAARPGGTAPELPPVAVENCAAAWRAGAVVAPGSHPSPNASGEYPVPPLVACVLPSGEAAVFPGPPSTCAGLGISVLKD